MTPGPDASVRRARPADAPAVGRLQVDAWRRAYAPHLPAGAFDGLTAEGATASWYDALLAPPTPQHRLLVALEADVVAGVAAVQPTTDTSGAELALLVVHPDVTRRGHGSRLLAAVADTARDNSTTTLITWVFDFDAPLIGLLTSAGWGDAGEKRVVRVGSDEVTQLLFHTAL